MAFTEQERQQAITYAINGAMFMFRATVKFATEITNGDPSSTGMPEWLQVMMMKREWVNLDNEMVIKYCQNRLDKKNTYALDNSDIKVIPEPIKIS